MAGHRSVTKQNVHVDGARMAYVDEGEGRPVVFLHGNPTSSYLWRHVIPEVSVEARCIAPDLIGMGDSEKVGGEYRFFDHRRYLDGFLDALGVASDGGVVFVGHDWGGALGFDWARRHPEAVAGIAYMETLVTPVRWDDWPEPSRRIFEAMRSEAGEEIILTKNVFVERILPASVLDPLPDEVMAEYRRPYLEPGEDRRPTLTWPREIPIEGEPADVAESVESYATWMAEDGRPKLFVDADPGSILTGRQRDLCLGWPNQEVVTVRGSHFIQEDSPTEIGRAIAGFISGL